MNKFMTASAVTLVNGWCVDEVYITPILADQILAEHNYDNRKMTPSSVRHMKVMMENGEFVTSPQGIMFSSKGRLLDGQTRLKAISETGIGQRMVVFGNLPDELFSALDQGRKRSMSDIFQNDSRIQQIINFIALLHYRRTPTTDEVSHILDIFGPAAEQLITTSGKGVKTRSSASVRAAVVLRSMQFRRHDELMDIYRAFIELELDFMPKSIISLFKQSESGQTAATGDKRNDLLVRAWIAFDPAKFSIEKIQVNNLDRHVSEIRAVINQLIDEHDSSISAARARSSDDQE